MIKYLLSILIFVEQLAFGQSADSLTQIIINYGRSHNSWGQPGIYARSETIELLQTPTGDFKVSRYYRVNASAGNDGNTFYKDTIELGTKRIKIIPGEKISFWLIQLNTNKENFTTSFIRPKLKPPKKNEIFQVAKNHDLLWMLKGSDADRTDTRKAISEIQIFYKLDSFLVFKRPTIEYEMIVSDSYNGLSIKTIKNNDTTRYHCQFFEPLGQPIIRYKTGYTRSSKVFNLEANTSAQSFLPGKSETRKVLDINNLKEEYIKWYLEKVMNE